MRRPRILRIASFEKQQQILSVEDNFAGDDLSRRIGNEPNDRKIGDGLSRTRLADDAQRFAALELKRNAVDGFDDAVFGFEVSAKVFNLEKIAVAVIIDLKLRSSSAGRARRASRHPES